MPTRPAKKKKPPAKPKQTSKTKNPMKVLKTHASAVMRALGKGHTERVYHRALITSLNRERIPHRSEVLSPIYFMGDVVGFGRCDIVIEKLAVELKANMHCPRKASSQLQKYIDSSKRGRRGAAQEMRGAVVNFSQRTGRPEVWLFDRGRRA